MKPTNNRLLTRHGFGVHSPWAYNFILNVLQEVNPYYAYDDLYEYWNQSSDMLPCYDQAEDELLFRVVNSINPKVMVEVGTGSSVSTAYMASVDKRVTCVTVDAPHPLTDQVRNSLSQFANVDYRSGDVLDLLEKFVQQNNQIDFVSLSHTAFFSQAFEMVLPHLTPASMVIVHDIKRNAAIRQWWALLTADARVGSTFAVGNVGILTFDTKKFKYNYKL